MKRYELINTKPLSYEPDYRMVTDEDGDYILYYEAQARIEALEVLAKYARHPNSCGYWSYTGKCTCGLAEAQSAAGV